MAKINGKYETIFIIDPSLSEDDTNALVERFKSMIEQNAALSAVDVWGKRRLAYPINDFVEGFYVLMLFESKPDFPAELDRVYKITDGILRSLIINTDEK